MLSTTAKYALRAVCHLASPSIPAHRPVPAHEIAQALGVPGNYLSKIMNQLARDGIVRSRRGPRGGFTLASPADQVTLSRVTASFDPTEAPLACLVESRPCDPDHPCVAHEGWAQVARDMRDFFTNTTVAELLAGAAESIGCSD